MELAAVSVLLSAGGGIGTLVGTGLSAIGAGLILPGVGNILYPTQDPTFEDNPQISFNFSGTQNTARLVLQFLLFMVRYLQVQLL